MSQTQATPPPLLPRQLAVLSSIAVVIGLLAGLAASVFIRVEHDLTDFLWETVPEWLGAESAPGWWVFVVLLTGALAVYGALQLPGKGGHAPLTGFAFDIGPRQIGSVFLASLATLSIGAVLGPEAPLIAIGTAVGAAAIRKKDSPLQRVMMVAGGVAAIGAIFGNPLITSMLLLEMAVVAGGAVASMSVLLPGLAAMASSYVLQIGIADWSGLGTAKLTIDGLPTYESLTVVDLLMAIPVAIVVGMLAIGTRVLGERVQRFGKVRPLPTILVAATAVAGLAVGARALTGEEIDTVVFSGQGSMGVYLELTSMSTVLVLLVAKTLAYSASLGGGFRGGPIFPIIAVGVLVAVLASLLVDGTSSAGLAATATAAATAAAIRFPFMGVLLAVLLIGPSGSSIVVLAILGAIIGLIMRLALDRFDPTSAASKIAPEVKK